jgi:hypothetical protein
MEEEMGGRTGGHISVMGAFVPRGWVDFGKGKILYHPDERSDFYEEKVDGQVCRPEPKTTQPNEDTAVPIAPKVPRLE